MHNEKLHIHITTKEVYFAECSSGLADGLRLIGHKVTTSDAPPINQPDILLVIGIHLFPYITRCKSRVLAGIQTEQLPLLATNSEATGRLQRNIKRFLSLQGKYDILFEWNPSLFEAGLGGNCFLPYGCVRRSFRQHDKQFDIAFIGNIHQSKRRMDILESLQARYSMYPDYSPGFGEAKEQAINSSRVLLNIHHYESFGMEAPRMFEYLALGACVLSEWSPNTYPFKPSKDFESFRSKQDLFHKLDALLNDDRMRNSIAEAGHKTSQLYTYEYVANLLSLNLLRCASRPTNSIYRRARAHQSLLSALWFDAKDILSKTKRIYGKNAIRNA